MGARRPRSGQPQRPPDRAAPEAATDGGGTEGADPRPRARDQEPAGGRIAGLVLAAGGGRRAGGPKALTRDPRSGRAWLADRLTTLADAGCEPVTALLGALADDARALAPAGTRIVVNPDWRSGLASSVRAALRAARASEPSPEAVLIALVDTPGLTVCAVQRIMAVAVKEGAADALVRATYDGRPGHPVLIGRNHWSGVESTAEGGEGAASYLRASRTRLVECSDVADGADVDTPLS